MSQDPKKSGFIAVPAMILVGSVLVSVGAFIELPGRDSPAYWDAKAKQLLLLGAGFGISLTTLVLGRIAVQWQDKLEASYLAPVVSMLIVLGIANFTPSATAFERVISVLCAGWSVAVIFVKTR